VCGVVDDESAVGLGTGFGADGDTASRCVVVDHALVVVPKYVLWWGRALKQDNKWHIAWQQDNTCTSLYNEWGQETVHARIKRTVRD
jgi:hypothetical protein